MIEFPGLIDWIDHMSLKELHSLHEDFEKANEKPVEFSKFVEMEYESAKDGWYEEMNYSRSLKVSNDEDGEIDLELAKHTFKILFDRAIRQGGVVRDIILENDFAPDHNTALMIVDAFWYNLIPAIERTIKELK